MMSTGYLLGLHSNDATAHGAYDTARCSQISIMETDDFPDVTTVDHPEGGLAGSDSLHEMDVDDYINEQ